MTDKQIQGVIVPMLTPLNPDETVDVPSLRSLVNYLIDNGVHGNLGLRHDWRIRQLARLRARSQHGSRRGRSSRDACR